MEQENSEYIISVPIKIWKDFKSNITKDKTINDVILELIKNYIEVKENGRKQ